jgi:hypothetical protein
VGWRADDATPYAPFASERGRDKRPAVGACRTPATAVSDASVRADGFQPNRPLTEQSTPGVYLVITASRTLYLVEVVADDSSPMITRYPCGNSLPLDGEPLTGVRSFFFDPTSGLGQIEWWKRNVADRDYPDRPYFGTVRSSSRVMLILSVHATGEHEGSSSRSEKTAHLQSLLDGLQAALAAVELDDDLVELLTVFVRQGRDRSGSDVHSDRSQSFDSGGADGIR